MQPIFSRNQDIEKIAFLNWRIGQDDPILNIINIADGHMQAAIELAKACIEDNTHKRADIFIFPIFTNANHAIELYLKAMNWTFSELLQHPRKLERGHNIKQLFEMVRGKMKVYEGRISLKEFNKKMKGLHAYITELFAKIQATPQQDRMDFSRYPIDVHQQDHFYVDFSSVEIDLENFVDRFQVIADELHSLSHYLYFTELHQWEE